jgi:hypothetical protein
MNSVKSTPGAMDLESAQGNHMAQEIVEEDEDNSEEVSPSNNKLPENNSGNSPENDNNPLSSVADNSPENTVSTRKC